MILTMENICKSYYRGKNEVPVLHDICLSVNKGDYLAIMGPSGSGKSTLMNIIGCLDKPSSGVYRLEGEDIATRKDNALAELRNKHVHWFN